MAFSCGFFNSKNQDRKYDATEFSAIFDGLISDGVYMSIGDHFNVTATSGMKINVGSGRAWFNHTWTLNTGSYEMTIDQAEVIQDRIDAVVLDVDHRLNYRTNTFVIVKGTRSTSPVKPTLIQEEYHRQYPLAYIRVPAGATSITQTNITNAVGTSECPFVTGIIKTISIDSLVSKWEVEWNQKLADEETEFNDWFSTMKTKLDGDTAGHLTNEQTWTTYTIASGNWSSSTVANLGDNRSYYTYTIKLNNIYADVPQVDRAPTGTNQVQTSAEATAFSKIISPNGWVICDTDAKTLTLYADEKPTTTFAIKVRGVA